MRKHTQNQPHDYGSKILYELSSLILNIIRSPPTDSVHRRRRSVPSFQKITPAGLATLLLGTALSLMLSGSVTFFVGFVMMPWVLGLLLFLYVVGVVSSISMIGRAVLFYNSHPPSNARMLL